MARSCHGAARRFPSGEAVRQWSPRVLALVGVVRIAVLAAAGAVAVWEWMPAPEAVLPRIPTGASFSLSMTQSRSATAARSVTAQLAGAGLPVFSRALRGGNLHQVIVGPYVAIEEVETVHRTLRRHGYAGRLVVDESIRRMHDVQGPSVDRDAGVAVLLVAAAGRLALVLELPTEPRQVESRRPEQGARVGSGAAAVFEVDAGPLTNPVGARSWVVPDGTPLLRQVAIEPRHVQGRSVARVRLTIDMASQAAVRVVGRRVYVDLWEPEPAPPHVAAGEPRVVASRLRPHGRDAATAAPEPLDPPAYAGIIRPALLRLERVEPFLIAAATSPNPEVLTALGATVDDLASWIAAVEAPPDARTAHAALLDAVRQAAEAVKPEFAGDRTAHVHAAFERVRSVSGELRQLADSKSQLATR